MSTSKNSIHFDISERKVLLRLIDIAVVLAMLYLVSQVFDFDYFKINAVHWVWSIVLAIYLTIFATIFELYNFLTFSSLTVSWLKLWCGTNIVTASVG